MKTAIKSLSPLYASVLPFLLICTAHAADGIWAVNSSGLWSSTSNWSTGVVADGSGATADFKSIDITADRTVSLDSPRSIGNLVFGDTTTSSAAGWTIDNNGNAANILTLAGTEPTIMVNGLGTGKAVTLSANIAGTSGFTKSGTGTLALTGSNTYSGTTNVNSGTLQFNSAGAIGGTGRSITVAANQFVTAGYAINNAFLNRLVENSNAFNINMTVASANALDFSSSTGANLPNAVLTAPGNFTYSGALTPGSSGYRLGNLNTANNIANTTVFTVSSTLSGAGNSVVISGTSPVYLTGATPSYGGGTTVNPGAALGFSSTVVTSLGLGSVQVGAGATILRAGANLDNTFLTRLAPTNNAFTIVANNAGSANALNLTNFPNASLATWDNAATATFAFTGTITPGTNGYRFGSTRVGNIINIGSLTVNDILTGTASLSLITGSLGNLNLIGSNTFSGNTINNASGKTITVNNNLAIQNSAIDTSGVGTFVLGTSVTTPTIGGLIGSKNLLSTLFATTGYNLMTSLTLNPGAGKTYSYSGIISDGAAFMALTKAGLGTQIFSSTNTYTGATAVTAGTLLVNYPGTLNALSAVAVNGGTLGGTGVIGGSVTVAAAGSLAPGDSASTGTLSIGGNLGISALANGGTGKLQFGIATPTTSDEIDVTGTLTIGTGALGLSDFVFTDLGGLQAGTYTLITTTGGIIGTLDPNDLSGTLGSLNGILRINGNNLELSYGDIDGDGLPDSYELAHTIPPSTTALNPGDDLDNDGLTNLQEYQHGTDPNLKDTDGDGFDDLYEINTGSDPTLDTSTPTTLTTMRTALEFRFNAASGVSYRIESSTDSSTWNMIEANIVGEGSAVSRFYTTENQPKRYYRVKRN